MLITKLPTLVLLAICTALVAFKFHQTFERLQIAGVALGVWVHSPRHCHRTKSM